MRLKVCGNAVTGGLLGRYNTANMPPTLLCHFDLDQPEIIEPCDYVIRMKGAAR